MAKRYIPPTERAQDALDNLWSASKEMCTRSHVNWGDDSDDTPSYEEVALVFAKQTYSFICNTFGDYEDYNDSEVGINESASKVFREMVERLDERAQDLNKQIIERLDQPTT